MLPHPGRSGFLGPARALLRELGLAAHADRSASALSYGDKRRVEVARALAAEPAFLLLDEPAAGMNEAESDVLLEQLAGLPDRRGELVALLGANGAGKSTTLLAIAGVLRSGAGRVRLDGRDIGGLSPERIVRQGIAMVPETRDVFADPTVLENPRLAAFIHRHDAAGVRADLERVHALFPILAARAGQPAGTLSGGEQQMLVIARALMSRPRLLMLDEPSLGLAATIVDQAFALIRRLRETRPTILLVEQNAAKALAIADRAYVLSLGRVAAAGPAAGIAAGADLRAIYLGA